MLLLVSLLLAASTIWLIFEIWLRRAPVYEAVVDELAVKASGEGDKWYRARITTHIDYSPEEHWVWINKRQHDSLNLGDVLSVHVRTIRGRRRLRAVGHLRRTWWIVAAIAYFLFNTLNAVFGD